MTEYDENGVPKHDVDHIEAKAEEVIRFFRSDLLEMPRSTPIMDFVKELHERFKLQISYDNDLGVTSAGSKILGLTRLKPLGIHLDRSLLFDDQKLRFTLAHELGHVVLHRGLDLAKTGYSEQEMVDEEYDVRTGKRKLLTARDWIEWQANRFASALLMPQSTIRHAVFTVQLEMGISRNLGTIILYDKEYSARDFNKVRDRLQMMYQTSRTQIEYRLTELGILSDQRDKNFRHISELFRIE